MAAKFPRQTAIEIEGPAKSNGRSFGAVRQSLRTSARP